MSKGSVWKNLPNGKTVRRKKIGGQSGQRAWLAREALESPAYRALSLSGHRILARIQLEQLYHAGKENGRLPVTFQDFEHYGVHRHAIAPAIREVAALGFIRMTQQGRAGNAEFRSPNKFALTHLPTEGGRVAATDDWRQIKTIDDAEAIAEAARKASARCKKVPCKNRKPVSEKGGGFTPGNRTSNPKFSPPETALRGTAETAPLSISRNTSSTLAANPPGARAEADDGVTRRRKRTRAMR
jgi:hypothetical protein